MKHHRRPRVPSYRLHKASGQAVVTLDGKDHYLGKHGTPESQAKYERLLALYLANGRALPDTLAHAEGDPARAEGAKPPKRRANPANAGTYGSGGSGYTVARLCDDLLTWAEREYRRPDGTSARRGRTSRSPSGRCSGCSR
jgi:hypothetical protein